MSAAPSALTCLPALLNWTAYLASFIPSPCHQYCLVTFVENSSYYTILQIQSNYDSGNADIFRMTFSTNAPNSVDGTVLARELIRCCWSLYCSQSTALNLGEQSGTCITRQRKESENHKFCGPFGLGLTATWFHILLHSQRPPNKQHPSLKLKLCRYFLQSVVQIWGLPDHT